MEEGATEGTVSTSGRYRNVRVWSACLFRQGQSRQVVGSSPLIQNPVHREELWARGSKPQAEVPVGREIPRRDVAGMARSRFVA